MCATTFGPGGSVGVMDEDTPRTADTRPAGDLLAPGSPTTVPTARQTLLRCLAVSPLLIAGLPLVPWLFLEVLIGVRRSEWLPAFCGYVIVVAVAAHLAHGPRPRLAPRTDRVPLKHAIAVAHRTGELPADPVHRTAAGALACQLAESAVMGTAGAIGLGLTALGRPLLPWAAAAAILAIAAVIHIVRARPGWRYLQLLHGDSRTG